MQCNTNTAVQTPSAERRPGLFAIAGYLVLALMIGSLLGRLGLFQTSFAAGASIGFFGALLIGLVAASSSCMAVSGGIMLATAAKFNDARKGKGFGLAPVIFFVFGRILSYAVLGGAIGAIGKNISFSPFVSGLIILIAAATMFLLGLDMLRILPKRLKRIIPRMPAGISRRIVNAESSLNPFAPFLLGAGTFFLPCGFTQALQLYALSTGSFVSGALVMGGFAIGTAPALVVLGWFAGSRKGKTGRFFFRLAGAAVVLLGIVNIGNGYNLLGLPQLSLRAADGDAAGSARSSDGQGQIINMAIGPDGYSPDSFTLLAGAPTRWIIDATKASGCQMSIVSRSLNIQKALSAGQNEIDLTAPAQPGTYQFSCPMGMYRGQLIVK